MNEHTVITNTPRVGESAEDVMLRAKPRGTPHAVAIEDEIRDEMLKNLNRTEPFSRDVHHPAHYNSHPSGIECIEVTEHMNFNVGNAIKYLWRAGLKSEDAITDLAKAAWYIEREIARVKRAD